MDKDELQTHLNTIESARSTCEQACTDLKDGLNTIEMEVDEIFQGLAEDEALEQEERERNG